MGYEYNINVVKEFKGTESFLGLKESSRNCQILESTQVKYANMKIYVHKTILFIKGMSIKNLSRSNFKTVQMYPTEHEPDRKSE